MLQQVCANDIDVEEGRELCVYLVQIAGWILVQDDDIGAQPFQAPVLVGAEELPDDLFILRGIVGWLYGLILFQ